MRRLRKLGFFSLEEAQGVTLSLSTREVVEVFKKHLDVVLRDMV